MNHWLLKSEPTCYSIDDLKRDKRAEWTGVRNYQARNLMRAMRKGDLALFYHSSVEPVGVFGTATIVVEAHPDPTALDAKDDHYDPKATADDPIWECVSVGFSKKFEAPVTLRELKLNPRLEGMAVLERGSRLSVQPVSKEHFDEVLRMAK